MFAKLYLIYLISCMSRFISTSEGNCQPKFINVNITIDNIWRTSSSTLYCGDNDCSRELHISFGENVSWQNGRELSQESSVIQGITEGITSGSTTSVKAEIEFPIKLLKANVGTEVQFHKSKTSENTIETTSSTGSTLSYSLTRENSMQTEEVVICTAKAGQGVKLLSRTNAIHFTGQYCRLNDYNNEGFYQCPPEDVQIQQLKCTYLDFKMLPFSGNAISTDIKCSSDNSDSKILSSASCLPFDSVCTRDSKCCGDTYCHYANPNWANGRCYNRM